MIYDPKIHHRKSIRLKEHDYSKEGAYFITICCHDLICRFGHVTSDPQTKEPYVRLNEFGRIAFEEWTNLKNRFDTIELDVFQIMPNHIHGIMILKNRDELSTSASSTISLQSNGRAGLAPAPIHAHLRSTNNFPNLSVERAGASPAPAPTLGDIVGAYKSLVANRCLDIYKSRQQRMGKFWQRDYWDVIIRDKIAYENISKYILNNPAKWMQDKLQRRGSLPPPDEPKGRG